MACAYSVRFRFILRLLLSIPLLALPATVCMGAEKNDLRAIVMRELNQVSEAADGLHKAMVAGDERQVELAIRDVIRQIDRVRTVAIYAKQHERPHLLKIMEAGRNELEIAELSFDNERQSRLRQAFQQLVNIVRIYKVGRSYGIYFCDKDKTSWVQKGTKALNPFSRAFRSCGVRANK